MSWAERAHNRPQNQYQIRRHHQPQQTQNQQSYVQQQQQQAPYRQPYTNTNNNNPSAPPRYQTQPQTQPPHASHPSHPPQPQKTQNTPPQAQNQPQTPPPSHPTLPPKHQIKQPTPTSTPSSSSLTNKENTAPAVIDNKTVESPSKAEPEPKTTDNHVNKTSVDTKTDTDAASQQSLASGTTPKKKPFSSLGVNSKMFFGTRYEVKCDETFAYYEGYVFDYDEKEEKLKVSYPWKPDTLVPVNYVRPLAIPITANWKPKQGDHVECQAKAEESEPYGWWDCTIKTVRDNLYLITYEGWDNHHEVLQHNMLRPYNDQEPFEDETIVREYLPISRERIAEFKSGADLSNPPHNNMHLMFTTPHDSIGHDSLQRAETSLSQLKRIAQQTKLIHLNYSPTEQKLILIGNKRRVSDAKMLIKFVWNLRELYKKKEEQVKLEQKTKQKEYDELSKCVCVRFEFNISLTKYVIGTKGENIQRAKQIKQVRHINVRNINEEVSECLILATDANAAEEARNILEMQQDFELIPAKVRKALIGKDGQQIQQLEQRSHVIKICTLEHLKYIRDSSRENYYQKQGDGRGRYPQFIEEEASVDPNFVKLIIIGPKEKVPFAKMLIKLQVESIEQKRKFIERQNIAKQEINNSGGPGGPGGGYEYYEGNYDGGYYNGHGRQSERRRRKQMHQNHGYDTQKSNKETGDFNYTQGGKNKEEYPSLGGGNKAGGKDVVDDAVDNQATMSWNEIDAAGIAEDEQEQQENEQQQQQQQQQRERRDYNRRRGKGKSGKNSGRYDRGGRRTGAYNKPVWKAKTNKSTQEANTSNQ